MGYYSIEVHFISSNRFVKPIDMAHIQHTSCAIFKLLLNIYIKAAFTIVEFDGNSEKKSEEY